MGLIIIILFICCGKCAMDYRYPIKLKNNSNHKIDVFVADHNKGYPDTTLTSQRATVNIDIQKVHYEDFSLEYEKIFSYLPSDTLSIYIFHTDTLNKYSWAIIKEKYMVLKRYDLSLDDLRKLDYTVPYPPSSAMSNMKMFPPYNKEE
ncbi:hypothetical protein D7D25_17530 [Proteiniphilum sp. X52]|nr:hypothetical protein D7D25_17530 [Proteiniphilum sp. X52]